jgi:cytochrome P450
MTVIAELLGLPARDRELFRTWADRLVEEQITDPTDPSLDHRIDDATADMFVYLLRKSPQLPRSIWGGLLYRQAAGRQPNAHPATRPKPTFLAT